ncbi:MAG: alpha/beta fold hydrolase [Chloroflexota bacterium]
MATITVNNIQLYYEIQGDGPPLLLIAGLGYDHWFWHKMVPGLAECFRVIVMDNRGVGRSDRPEGPYTAQLLAADVAALLAELEIGKTAVLGHSMGGFVAQALALDYPHLVSYLVLAATNFGGPRHIPVTAEALAVLMDSSSDPVERVRRGVAVSCAPGFEQRQPDLLAELVAYRQQNPLQPGPYQAQLAIGLALMSETAAFESRLPQITAPTLILFGEHDKVVPPANADLLAQQIPHSQVVLLPDAGHFFPLETAVAAVTAVADFIRSHDSSVAPVRET